MGYLNRIFNMWPDKNCVQGKKIIGGRDSEGSFQVQQHPTGFITCADNFIFSTKPAGLVFKTIPVYLTVETFGIVWVLGGLWDGRI